MGEIWRVRSSNFGTTAEGCGMRSSVETKGCRCREGWRDLGLWRCEGERRDGWWYGTWLARRGVEKGRAEKVRAR